MENSVKCPACTSIAQEYNYGDGFIFYDCPVCGRFELKWPVEYCTLDRNHLAAYLVYHSYQQPKDGIATEYRYNTIRDKDFCDEIRNKYKQGDIQSGCPVHMDSQMIESWYPRNFAERVDKILLYIAKNTNHIGQPLLLSVNRMLNVLFVDKQTLDQNVLSPNCGQWTERNEEAYVQECNYVLRYLRKQNYVETDDFNELKAHSILLTPVGYARVDELQKNSTNGRSVLVAMKFGNDTRTLREAIRKGISDAGYLAIFIDEVQHNDFITPELLKHIRDSKFVVADLTHQNNGAYFEEGYAMGLGKPVIQLCKSGTVLHFDIAQKNTIIWDSEEDIPQRLCNRIKATIE